MTTTLTIERYALTDAARDNYEEAKKEGHAQAAKAWRLCLGHLHAAAAIGDPRTPSKITALKRATASAATYARRAVDAASRGL